MGGAEQLMRGLCDLHIHSFYSDGTVSPAQIVAEAIRCGLSAAALTDHNTVAGLKEFIAASNAEMEAIPGVEISAGYEGKELHIVGLFLRESEWEHVENFLRIINRRKEESNRALIARLNQAGYALNYNEIKEQHQGNINRAIIAARMMEKGYIREINEAFRGPLSSKCGYYVPPERISAFEAIAFLKSVHAVSVLAHPYLSLQEAQLHSFLGEAKPFGLTAMETHYSAYTEETTEAAVTMAEKHGLLQSGGSDFHGENKPDIQIGTGKGSLKVPYTFVEKMRNMLSVE